MNTSTRQVTVGSVRLLHGPRTGGMESLYFLNLDLLLAPLLGFSQT
jgi:hypothetical protein